MSIKFTVVVECEIDGEGYYDEYAPQSQSWDDIVSCYKAELSKVCSEIDSSDIEQVEEWTLNDTQPITKIILSNGYYEVYVCKHGS